MGDLFKSLGDSFSQMGSALTFFAIVIIVAMYIFKGPISELIKKIRFKAGRNIKSKNKEVKDLWSHDLFLTAEEVRRKVNTIKFTTYGDYDEAKTKLLRILVNFQIDYFIKNLKQLIKGSDMDKLDGQDLKYTLIKKLTNSVDQHNEATLEKLISLGIREDDTKYLIDEYDFFREEVMRGFVERIESITTNDNYHCNYDRLSAVFEVLAMGLYLIPKDCITACNRINGKFRKYKVDDDEITICKI